MTRTSDDEWQVPPSLLSRHLTPQGREEYVRQVHDFIAGMDEQLRRGGSDQRNDRDPEYTAAAVRAARTRYDRSLNAPDPQHGRNHLGLGLQAIGTVGTPVMAAFLHSTWQIGLFAGFIMAGLVGLGLGWRRDVRLRRPA